MDAPSSRNTPFIVLEGIDGAGTTTQSERLAARLRQVGRQPVLTHEPSTGPVGTLIRQALTGRLVVPGDPPGPMGRQTLALLFAADRLDHVASTIRPALGAGRPVVCDRYYHSSLAYQGDVEREEDGAERVDYDWVWTLNERARVPDITFFLDLDVERSLARIQHRSQRDIYETRAKLERLVVRYTEVMGILQDRGQRIIRFDGGEPVEEIHERIWDELQGVFGSLAMPKSELEEG